MPYLRNTWYVAAWDSELKDGEILSRRLLDEPVVLFRRKDGTPQALSGVCPHRYASLSRGTIVGDAIQCGYHGLQFDGSGACVKSPFGNPPRTMKATAYPVVERYSAIWIWMGDAAAADPALIPDLAFQDPEHAYVGKDYLSVKASYELEIDNILDLSHIEFLHPTTLGSSQVSAGSYECKVDGDTVWSNRDIDGDVLADGLSASFGMAPGTPVDRWVHVKWTAPANMVIYAGAVPAGEPKTDMAVNPTAHLFTPETSRTSHYWFSVARPRSAGPEGAAWAEETIKYLRFPFESEDLPMLEDQQANIGDRPMHTVPLGWLPGDAAGARARNLLRGMVNDEQEAANAPKQAVAA